jgi:hypothetical protein
MSRNERSERLDGARQLLDVVQRVFAAAAGLQMLIDARLLRRFELAGAERIDSRQCSSTSHG